jgi:hypothetical protein
LLIKTADNLKTDICCFFFGYCAQKFALYKENSASAIIFGNYHGLVLKQNPEKDFSISIAGTDLSAMCFHSCPGNGKSDSTSANL